MRLSFSTIRDMYEHTQNTSIVKKIAAFKKNYLSWKIDDSSNVFVWIGSYLNIIRGAHAIFSYYLIWITDVMTNDCPSWEFDE